MFVYLECVNCSWSGTREELVALTDDLDDQDFTHCPNCGGTEFEEDEQEDNPYL